MPGPTRSHRAQDPPAAVERSLAQGRAHRAMPDLVVGECIGRGYRCDVHAARWRDAPVVVKRYRPEAIVRHAGLVDLPIAAFEFRRNLACLAVAGLGPHVARPIAYGVEPTSQWLVQERLDGRLCSDVSVDWCASRWQAFRRHLARLVGLAHRAGIHDLDLDPRNVMLVARPGDLAGSDPVPVLFDFNLVPFTERRRPTLDGWLWRLGLIEATHRDLRRLRRRFR